MRIVSKVGNADFPFKWVDLNYLPNSLGEKKEIYLKEHLDMVEELMRLFNTLLGDTKNQLLVYYQSWWDFCLETWDIETETHDYSIEQKSEETKAYLKLLMDSGIEIGYSGACKCENWDVFLPIVLKCLVDHQAIYSHLYFDTVNNFFFYFHHSGSIGFYYKKDNEVIGRILSRASIAFDIVE